MSDIEILKEMIKDTAIVLLDNTKKNDQCVVLEEKRHDIATEQSIQYSITIHGMPKDSEVVVIKTDEFPSPKTFLNNLKHECKRCDFVIVMNSKNRKVILYIELKATTKTAQDKDIILQFKGAQCVVAYCQEIGKLFWRQTDFLKGYSYRFVNITDININKKPTRIRSPKGHHDQPEKMLKISSPHHLEFNQLIK